MRGDLHAEKISRALGVHVSLVDPDSLSEALHVAQSNGYPEHVAWLCTQLGDLAFSSEGRGVAEQWYARGQRTWSEALGPWLGLAQCSVASGQWLGWETAIGHLQRALPAEPDGVLAQRAEAYLEIEAFRRGDAQHGSAWSPLARARELSSRGEGRAGWHVYMAAGLALGDRGVDEAALASYEEAMGLAQSLGLSREHIWSGIALVQRLRIQDNMTRADAVYLEILEAAEALGEPRLMELLLRLGSDLAAELGLHARLVETLRRRAVWAGNRGDMDAQAGHLHQAFMVSWRARQKSAASIGEELVEQLLSGGLHADNVHRWDPFVNDLTKAGSAAYALELALAQARVCFSMGDKHQAVTRLGACAKMALDVGDREQGRELLTEAIHISDFYGLDLAEALHRSRLELLPNDSQ